MPDQQTQVLESVIAACSDLLDPDTVTPNDNFFECGGDSLLAIRVVSRLQSDGWDARPSDVLEPESISEIARRVAARSSGANP